MKLNKKGYMLVEIIVSFTIAFAMLYFLMEIVINIKNISDDYYVQAKLEIDQILVNKAIETDIVNLGLKTIFLKTDTDDLKVIDLVFNNNINKRLTIKKENNNTIFMYGLYRDNDYDKNDLFVKTLDERLDIGEVKIEVSCYKDGECSDTEKNKMLKINIPATSVYTDNEYGINLDILYNYDEIKILRNIKADFLHDENIQSLEYTNISCSTEGDSCNVKFPEITFKNGFKLLEWRDNNNNSVNLNDNEFTINLNNINKFKAYSSAETIQYIVYFEQTNGTTSSIVCDTDAITNRCINKTTPSITVSSGYVVDGWYTAKTGGSKFKDSNQNFDITSDLNGKRYYARVKADPCGSTTPIKYTCSNGATCSLSNSNKILTIKTSGTLKVGNASSCISSIEYALIGGGSGGNGGGLPWGSAQTGGGTGGTGGKGGRIYKGSSSINDGTYTITIGTGGTAGAIAKAGTDGTNSIIKNSSNSVLFNGNSNSGYTQAAGGTGGTGGSSVNSVYGRKGNDGENGTEIKFGSINLGYYGGAGGGGGGGSANGQWNYTYNSTTQVVGGNGGAGNGAQGGNGAYQYYGRATMSTAGSSAAANTGAGGGGGGASYGTGGYGNYASKGGDGGSGIIILYSSKGWQT